MIPQWMLITVIAIGIIISVLFALWRFLIAFNRSDVMPNVFESEDDMLLFIEPNKENGEKVK